MQVNHRRRLVLGSITSIALLASLLVVASPAQAYPGLSRAFAIVRTEAGCAVLGGTIPVNDTGTYCFLDDTYFRRDPNGAAIKVQLHFQGTMVAKVEFHPQDEGIWVYDTANDGDGINAELYDHATGIRYGPYSAPGTSSRIDFRRVDIPDNPEQHLVSVIVHDGPGRTNRVATVTGGRT